jgi:hypothetical protein
MHKKVIVVAYRELYISIGLPAGAGDIVNPSATSSPDHTPKRKERHPTTTVISLLSSPTLSLHLSV